MKSKYVCRSTSSIVSGFHYSEEESIRADEAIAAMQADASEREGELEELSSALRLAKEASAAAVEVWTVFQNPPVMYLYTFVFLFFLK